MREWADLGEGEASPLTLREPQLAQARAALAAAEAALEQAGSTSTAPGSAPYDGRVRAKQVDVGQFVGPGTPLATVYATDYAEIRLPVPTTSWPFSICTWAAATTASRTGGALAARSAGAPRSWQGRVVRTEGEFDPRSRMLGLDVEVADPFGRRTAGGECCRWACSSRPRSRAAVAENVAVLPRAALRDGDRVLVVDAEDRLRFRDGRGAAARSDEVIVGGGLEAGERVCVSPLETVVDGMRVRRCATMSRSRPSASGRPGCEGRSSPGSPRTASPPTC